MQNNPFDSLQKPAFFCRKKPTLHHLYAEELIHCLDNPLKVKSPLEPIQIQTDFMSFRNGSE